jgi:DNA polymerase-3 subunit delta'
MQYPDLEIVQTEQGKTLKVGQVRESLHWLSLAPYEGRYRVALFLRFEEATEGASNALLKTLEEPPPNVVLILTAENAENLLPTIVSRCEELRLRPVPVAEVSQGLERQWGVLSDQAMMLAHISGGRPGYALQLYNDPKIQKQRDAYLDDHATLLRASRVDRFAFAKEVCPSPGVKPEVKDKMMADLHMLLSVWMSLWRDILMRIANSSTPITNLDRVEEIQVLADLFNMDTVKAEILAIERTQYLLNKNINCRLAMEVLLLDLPRI